MAKCCPCRGKREKPNRKTVWLKLFKDKTRVWVVGETKLFLPRRFTQTTFKYNSTNIEAQGSLDICLCYWLISHVEKQIQIPNLVSKTISVHQESFVNRAVWSQNITMKVCFPAPVLFQLPHPNGIEEEPGPLWTCPWEDPLFSCSWSRWTGGPHQLLPSAIES